MFRLDAYDQSRTHFAQDRLRSYIHLNPLRAGIVKDLKALKTYPHSSGHGVIMGKLKND